MLNITRLKYSFFLFLSYMCFSQDMNSGFTYLENGKYDEAETYFKNILITHPNNRTAKLCYGRAVGLGGNAGEGLQIFTDLLTEYPNDFEIKLNYAEALLWNKKYPMAESYYKDLITKDSLSFPALLGYANTLSNLKKYDLAMDYITTALKVSSNNPNALNSKKYIVLGYADQYTKKQEYNKAITLLNTNLILFKDDKETLLNLANTYITMKDLEKAKNTYDLLYKQNRFIGLNGLALVSHLNNKNKKALRTSTKAFKALTINDTAIAYQTTERYIQVLIWNGNYKKATSLIDSLKAVKPNENRVIALQAMMYTYTGDFKKSNTEYSNILKNDVASFDGNLGKANALKGLGLYNEAYKSAYKTLSYYDNQKDAIQFIKTLDEQFTPFAKVKALYSFDDGDNIAHTYQTNIELPLSTKFKILGDYSYRFAKNTILDDEANTNTLLIGGAYQLYPKVTIQAKGGVIVASTTDGNYTQFLTDVSLNTKPFKLQTLQVGYNRKLQNFNASLLEKEIVQNNYYMSYNMGTNFNLGWFGQYYYTKQSDQNTINNLFTALYYNVLKKPILKVGVNYQYMAFKDQHPNIYFSPERFNTIEVFVDFLRSENSIKEKQWFYNLNGAIGYQFIEDNDRQNAFRIQGALGYKFSNRCFLNAYSLHSNLASATASGFKFTELGLQFKWYITKLPLFKKNI